MATQKRPGDGGERFLAADKLVKVRRLHRLTKAASSTLESSG